MCKVLICANQKGGVAKSTSVVNLGIGLARAGKKVLLIDNDPQGSLTEALGYPEPDKIEITLSKIMEWVLNEEEFDLSEGIIHHKEGIDLMPANIELSGVETSLVGIMSSETVLKEYIELIRDDYDYILVDCSPNLGQLTLNALVIISTLYTADGPLAGGYTGGVIEILNKANLAQTAFGVVFGEKFGSIFVAVCLFFFAFSTILGWNLFAKINIHYLFGPKAIKPFMLTALVFIFLGTLASNDLVWELSDMFNQLMVIPNAVALFALSGMVVKSLKEHK